MNKFIDLTNIKFGRLTVLERCTKLRVAASAYWVCRCECGSLKSVSGQHLRNGRTVSCGCYLSESATKRSIIDIAGKQYGKLTVLSYASPSRYGAQWECKCECGNTKTIRGTALRFHHVESCGCNRISALRKPGQGKVERKDIAGKKFGMLTAIRPDGKGKDGRAYWHCACDCGETKRVRGTDLSHGNTKSCGCGQLSGLIGTRTK